jgi:hypothetical protein
MQLAASVIFYGFGAEGARVLCEDDGVFLALDDERRWKRMSDVFGGRVKYRIAVAVHQAHEVWVFRHVERRRVHNTALGRSSGVSLRPRTSGSVAAAATRWPPTETP